MIEWTFTDTMIIIASLLLILNSFYKMRKYNEKLKESESKGYVSKMNIKGTKKKNQVVTANIFE